MQRVATETFAKTCNILRTKRNLSLYELAKEPFFTVCAQCALKYTLFTRYLSLYSSSAYMRPSSLCRAWMFCCLSNTLLCNAFISWWLMLPPFAKRACDNIF